MKAIQVTACVLLMLMSAAHPLSADHSWPVNMSQFVTVKGTVTDFTWATPHPMITIEVRTTDGAIEKWFEDDEPVQDGEVAAGGVETPREVRRLGRPEG